MDLTKVLSVVKSKKTGFFAAGVLFGTAGIKVLASDDAKKVYTNCTAAVLRAKETVMNTVTTVQENAEDIYEGAKQINEERAEAKATSWPNSSALNKTCLISSSIVTPSNDRVPSKSNTNFILFTLSFF